MTKRYETLDVVRGFALLGILVMNIQSFSMPSAAYMNPEAFGDLSGGNFVVWYLSALFADAKFMTLFSMLFGAGMALMADRASSRGRSAAKTHYRRMLGLLLIGLIHAYVFWMGDILFHYAVCGAIVYPLIRLRCRYLLSIAAVLLAVRIGIDTMLGLSMPYWDAASKAEFMADWHPTDELLTAELVAYRGSWFSQNEYRFSTALMMQSFVLPLMLFWRIAALMLVGAALMKTGLLTGQRSVVAYRRSLLVGFGLGLPLVGLGIHWNQQAGWEMEYSFFLGQLPNFIGSILVAFGYIGALEILRRSRWGKTVTKVLSPVGRLALSNYLFQTLACTTIFYGHGLGWFGYVSRMEQMAIVAAVWLFQIAASAWWIRRHRYGPAEAVWRRLSYGAEPSRVAAELDPNRGVLS